MRIDTTSPRALRSSPGREAELLAATLAELRGAGYDRMTVDAVAARARASKATIYRRWPTKADLTVAAFASAVAEPPAGLDTGSLRGDLLAMLDALVAELEQLGDVVAALISGLRRNPDLADAMHRGYINPRRQLIRDAFARARQRGEVTVDVDEDLIWQLGPAVLFFRVLLAGEAVDTSTARRLVDQVILRLIS